MSDIVQTGGQIPVKLADWAAKCPDPEFMARAIAHRLFMASPATCYECGVKTTNAELREDYAYWESGQPICKECWHFYDKGTVACPGYKAPRWPEKRTIGPVPIKYDGVLVEKDTRKRVGTVTAFHPKTGMCHRVTRDAYPGAAEMGSICLETEDVIDRVPTTFTSEDDPYVKTCADLNVIFGALGGSSALSPSAIASE